MHAGPAYDKKYHKTDLMIPDIFYQCNHTQQHYTCTCILLKFLYLLIFIFSMDVYKFTGILPKVYCEARFRDPDQKHVWASVIG